MPDRGCGAEIGDGLRCGDTDKKLGLPQFCEKCLDEALGTESDARL